jgi:hypothetical protein
MNTSDHAAFEVFNPHTGQRFKVWADGRTEGFGDATCIVNRIPSLIAAEVQCAKEEAGLINVVKLTRRAEASA